MTETEARNANLSAALAAASAPHWGVGYLYRDSDPAEVARSIVDEISEGTGS